MRPDMAETEACEDLPGQSDGGGVADPDDSDDNDPRPQLAGDGSSFAGRDGIVPHDNDAHGPETAEDGGVIPVLLGETAEPGGALSSSASAAVSSVSDVSAVVVDVGNPSSASVVSGLTKGGPSDDGDAAEKQAIALESNGRSGVEREAAMAQQQTERPADERGGSHHGSHEDVEVSTTASSSSDGEVHSTNQQVGGGSNFQPGPLSEDHCSDKRGELTIS